MVPVTPMTSRLRDGWPYQLAPNCASAARVSPTRTQGVSAGISCWHSTTAAPFCTASGIKRCPSTVYPGIAAKRTPGVTVWDEWLTPVISISMGALVSSISMPSSSDFSFIAFSLF